MAENFYTIVTAIGQAKIANTYALGTKLNLTKFNVGDGGGAYYNPTADQLALKHQVWSGNINSISVDPDNPNWIVMEIVIPSTEGGFMIREAAVFDDVGNMIAIGKYPETYKPVVAEGSAKDLYIKMILEVSSTASITLKIDPSVILATKKDITTLQNQIANISVPVKSVNSKTGDVVLNAGDIKAADGQSVESHLADSVQQLGLKSDKIIKDDTTTTKYEMGINNGLLYYRVVV
jgi:phage-related tail fiber protein